MSQLQTENLLIENGHLVDPSQGIDRPARILVVDGRVAGIDVLDAQLPQNVTRVEARGLIVTPGFVDLGTELGEPGHQEDETIETGCKAALAGGFTTLACSASTNPPLDSQAAIQFVFQKAARLNLARVVVLGCVSKERAGQEMAEIGGLVEAGAVGISDAPMPIENTELLKRALEYCLMFGIPLLDHPEIRSLAPGGVMHEGQTQLILGLRPMPAEAEDLATVRDLRLVEATGGKLHLMGISTETSVEICRRAKSRGIAFTAGIYAANFHLLDERLRTFDSNCKVNPPLRSNDHVEACRAGLADGTIDIISSGHRPRALEKKMQELDLSPFGMSSLETCLGQVVTHLIATHQLDWSRAIAKLSTNPAKLLGLNAGSLAVGMPADITLIDPTKTWTVIGKNFYSKSGNTPLEGETLTGRVMKTYVGGIEKFALAE